MDMLPSIIRRFAALPYIRNRSIRALLIADSMVLTGAAMLAPLYALFVDRVGGDILDAGITAAALALGSGATCLIAGRFIDRRQRKKPMLAAAYLVIAAGFVLYSFAGSVWELAAIQVVIGVAQAVQATSFDALFTVSSDRSNAGEQWGAWEALAYFTQALGALAGSLIVTAYGFEALFYVMAALTLAGGLYIARLPDKIVR